MKVLLDTHRIRPPLGEQLLGHAASREGNQVGLYCDAALKRIIIERAFQDNDPMDTEKLVSGRKE